MADSKKWKAMNPDVKRAWFRAYRKKKRQESRGVIRRRRRDEVPEEYRRFVL